MNPSFWAAHLSQSSFVAKGVYLVLLALSVVAWAIMISKINLLWRTGRGTRHFLELWKNGRRDPIGLYRQLGASRSRPESPLVAVFVRGCEELLNIFGRGNGPHPPAGILPDRVITPLQFTTLSRTVAAAEDAYFMQLEHLLIILATTVSAAPFLGLLGTVWGILEAFQSMGHQGSTGVTAVGSGISEALIATAFGLVVAIPALLGYNFIGSRIRELAGEADQFCAEFLALVEREFVRD